MTATIPTEAELAATIRGIVAERLADTGAVDLGGHLFARVPCSRRKLYAIARKLAGELGAVYVPSEYVPSGNRAFQRNHRRGRYHTPSIVRGNR